MTAQFAETLIYEGKAVSLLSNPLTDYFRLGGHDPGFQSTSTALWRGYIGTWEIMNDRLYLIALRGTLESGEKACLESVFPGFPDRVFAHWFSGRLRIPQGRQLEYVHMGYGSTYERDVILTLKTGALIGQEVRTNGVGLQDAPEGYSIGGMTVWKARKQVDLTGGHE